MMLDVTPEQLPVIGAQLGTTHAGLSATAGSANGAVVPNLAAMNSADPIQTFCSTILTAYNSTFFAGTTDGIGQLMLGAQALAPASAAFVATDVQSGVTVASVGRNRAI
ncbi:hypothetical protein NN3_23120 [Nocardia neocaledoniensis NBRC 108232]|uniref:PE family protein n=1 Tax=Nocardia neocaledoniensis TaxID=236511 RepID=A0A317N0T1_9NOCA|nr:hypothetical protein [Nocardia neocaledoniensis]PWV66958.1 hypothetical protein DFR69_12223 [Nocardia neocaledoniensis]GEM31305.1 hypothetical protein NN3_23120 [Nocardia neocaledoniensis NBRC 108232]